MRYITRKEVLKINKELAKFPIYHLNIPLQEIFNILLKYQLIPIQEDNTSWSGFLCGDSSSATFTLGDYKENANFYVPIKGTLLSVCWYKMKSGKYEITTYLT